MCVLVLRLTRNIKWYFIPSSGIYQTLKRVTHPCFICNDICFLFFCQPAHNDKTANPEVARLMKELIKSRKQLKGLSQTHVY